MHDKAEAHDWQFKGHEEQLDVASTKKPGKHWVQVMLFRQFRQVEGQIKTLTVVPGRVMG